jgi:hypothetical protein
MLKQVQHDNKLMADIFIAPKQTGPSINIFSTFSQNPKGISFEGQKEKESVILFLRSHSIRSLPSILITLFLIILPITIWSYVSNLGLNFLSSPIVSRFTTILILLYCLLVFTYIFTSFLHWFYNVFIATSQRVVEIDYSDIVIHDIVAADLTHIEKVNYAQAGFIQTLLNYGNLFIHTKGDGRNFEALYVPKPKEAAHIFEDLTGIK